MRNAEITGFDFDFEEGVKTERTRNFRSGDTYLPITGMQPTRGTGIAEQIFTPEREARIIAHQKRIQKGLKKLRKGKRIMCSFCMKITNIIYELDGLKVCQDCYSKNINKSKVGKI